MPKFPCKYIFGGKTYSHNEFRSLLASGALGHLMENKIISLPEKTINHGKAETGERPALPAAKEQTLSQEGDLQPGGVGGGDRSPEIRQEPVSETGGPREKVTESKINKNAIQEQSAAKVHVLEASGHREKVGGRDESKGTVDQKAATEKNQNHWWLLAKW